MRFWKSKEEKEFERKQRLRSTKRIVNKTIEDCGRLRDNYRNLAIEARRGEDDYQTKMFAAKMVLLDNHVKKMGSLGRALQDIELSRNMGSSFTSFAGVIKDFSRTMEKERVSAKTAAEMSRDLDKILRISEEVDSIFDTVLESMNDKILDVDVSDSELDRALKSIELEAGMAEEESFSRQRSRTERTQVSESEGSNRREPQVQQDPLDKRIQDGLDKIRKQRKK